jgi:hypothetical protein
MAVKCTLKYLRLPGRELQRTRTEAMSYFIYLHVQNSEFFFLYGVHLTKYTKLRLVLMLNVCGTLPPHLKKRY